MDNKLFFKESVLPVTLFCSALMFSPVGATQVNAATNGQVLNRSAKI